MLLKFEHSGCEIRLMSCVLHSDGEVNVLTGKLVTLANRLDMLAES